MLWPADSFFLRHIPFPACRILQPEQPCILFLLRQNFPRVVALLLLQNVAAAHPGVFGNQGPAVAEGEKSRVGTSMELRCALQKIRRRAEVKLRALRLCFSRAVLYQKLNLIPNWILRGPRSLFNLPKFPFVLVNVPLSFPLASRWGTRPKPGSNPLKFVVLKRLNISARN